MKKISVISISVSMFLFLLIAAAVSCTTFSNDSEPADDLDESEVLEEVEKPFIKNGTQLVISPKFDTGFDVRSLSTEDGAKVFGRLNYGDESLVPDWIFAQWWSRYNILEGTKEKLSDGVYKYADKTKEFTVDYKNGQLNFKAMASNCYDKPRKKSSEMWLHLLIEQTMGSRFLDNPEKLALYKVSDMAELWFEGKFKLTYFEDKMDGKDIEWLHAAQFLVFINLQDLASPRSEGFGQLMHFGMPVFDNRYEFSEPYQAQDMTTPNFIYSLPSKVFTDESFFKDGKPFGSPDNEWMTIELDILPEILKAFEKAKSIGYLPDTELDELYIGALCCGWEVPGTYDAEMQMKDVGLYAIKTEMY
ncbi:MAG: hypothetical protein FWH48_10905 [Oscillospiraceae bacterium]|nr:hypothetical protein [Oscillospiraceae bacterium]